MPTCGAEKLMRPDQATSSDIPVMETSNPRANGTQFRHRLGRETFAADAANPSLGRFPAKGVPGLGTGPDGVGRLEGRK
jgi:hypothetical protein